MEQNKAVNKTYTDIRRFAEAVCMQISRSMGESSEVKLQEVRKNNGVILQGLIILTKEKNLSPTIYLNPFWEKYVSGTPMERVLKKIMEIYETNVPEKNVDMSFFREYDKVRSRICYKLVNSMKNKLLLERIPHVDMLDLSLCFYYAYEDDVLGSGSILISNHHMEMWNCTTEMLMREAIENTRHLYPCKLFRMEELLEECAGEEMDVPMKVLTNLQKCNGATCMVYPGVLREISERLKEDLYILPSSIHEVILLPYSEVPDPECVHDMIRQVNLSCVDREEILSDSLYFYDYSKNCIDIA